MKAVRLDDLVARVAAGASETTAVVVADRVHTYGELDGLANQLAWRLQSQGLVPRDRVGIHAHKSFEIVAAMIGVLRAGGVYVPIDPLAPPRRAAQLAESCGLRFLIAERGLLRTWQATCDLPPTLRGLTLLGAGEEPRVLGVPCAGWETLDTEPSEPPPPVDRGPDDLAYILYTSGSTGTPKGVMISHRNALAFVWWAVEAFALKPGDRLANHAPLHFDLSVLDVYGALAVGASVALIDEVTAHTPHRLVRWLAAKQPTVWYSVPSALVLMMTDGGLDVAAATSLRLVLFAGEEISIGQLRRLVALLPQATCWNLYGPTETNVCTAFKIEPAQLERYQAVPIGRPCSGDRVRLLDANGARTPAGTIGELCVAGPTVMLGYWPGRDGERSDWYRTGDLAEWNADGDLIFHGRRDSMVKVRGYRIEMREVEEVLVAHAGVREGVVVAIDDGTRAGKSLVAHVIPAQDALSVLDLKRYCGTRLPPYMVPHQIRFHACLPRTSSGKVDRVALASGSAI